MIVRRAGSAGDFVFFFFSSRRRHTRCSRDWSSDVCSSDLLAEKMIAEVKDHPKSQPGVVAGGLDLRFYSVKRLGALALVSFDVEDTSSGTVDLEDPQVNLITASNNPKDRKKPLVKTEPVEITQSVVSSKQLSSGARAVCLVAFKPPVHDSDQQVVLSISNRAMADKPATYRLE